MIPSTTASGGTNQAAPSTSQPLTQQLLPSLSSQPTANSAASAPPLKKPSSTHSTLRLATDHHWYNKQLAAQTASLNPPNPNLTSQLQLLPNQQTPQGLIYPHGTSSRGFTPNHQLRTDGDRSVGAAAYSLQQLARPDVLTNNQMHLLKNTYFNPSHPGLVGPPTTLPGFPVTSYPKVAFSMAAASERNGIREARSKDEALTMILNRKVRVSEGSSLYALCRSWLKNGCHDQIQPKHSTRYSFLPRPLPSPAQTPTQKSNETTDIEEDDKEDEKSVEQLSSEDLLKKHIKRAKRVRSRLHEERLQRITRYKARLATLLPSPVEAMRDETPAGS
uniref:Uncharacterized protein n=1 Tax=Kalanchoe fedtschenkoi TaxID=63787 RepID=A0A7N0T368_KALFE